MCQLWCRLLLALGKLFICLNVVLGDHLQHCINVLSAAGVNSFSCGSSSETVTSLSFLSVLAVNGLSIRQTSFLSVSLSESLYSCSMFERYKSSAIGFPDTWCICWKENEMLNMLTNLHTGFFSVKQSSYSFVISQNSRGLFDSLQDSAKLIEGEMPC